MLILYSETKFAESGCNKLKIVFSFSSVPYHLTSFMQYINQYVVFIGMVVVVSLLCGCVIVEYKDAERL